MASEDSMPSEDVMTSDDKWRTEGLLLKQLSEKDQAEERRNKEQNRVQIMFTSVNNLVLRMSPDPDQEVRNDLSDALQNAEAAVADLEAAKAACEHMRALEQELYDLRVEMKAELVAQFGALKERAGLKAQDLPGQNVD